MRQPKTNHEMIKRAKKTSDPSQQISTHSNGKVVRISKRHGAEATNFKIKK